MAIRRTPTSSETPKWTMIDGIRLDGADDANAADANRRSQQVGRVFVFCCGSPLAARAQPGAPGAPPGPTRARARTANPPRPERLTSIQHKHTSKHCQEPAVLDPPRVRVQVLPPLQRHQPPVRVVLCERRLLSVGAVLEGLIALALARVLPLEGFLGREGLEVGVDRPGRLGERPAGGVLRGGDGVRGGGGGGHEGQPGGGRR